ncbi:MAG: MipA/OmpV family protein [Marinobacter sp.]|nr:MipA/OmpV family protein [Marinobacter sp.]
MWRILLPAVIGVALAGSALAAEHDQTRKADGDDGASDWQVSAGLGVAWTPDYEGADTYGVMPLPWLSLNKGRFFFNPIRGAGVDLLSSDQWTLAPVISYVFGRDSTGALSDFKAVDGSVVAGLLAGWKQGHWKLDAEVVKPVSGDLDGVRLSGDVRYRARVTKRLNYAIGPGVRWGNRSWNEALFNISPADAARSDLPAYRASGPYLRASLNTRVSYYLTRQINVSTIASYNRLLGDAADSPIVKDVGNANQWFVGVLGSYRF